MRRGTDLDVGQHDLVLKNGEPKVDPVDFGDQAEAGLVVLVILGEDDSGKDVAC